MKLKYSVYNTPKKCWIEYVSAYNKCCSSSAGNFACFKLIRNFSIKSSCFRVRSFLRDRLHIHVFRYLPENVMDWRIRKCLSIKVFWGFWALGRLSHPANLDTTLVRIMMKYSFVCSLGNNIIAFGSVLTRRSTYLLQVESYQSRFRVAAITMS